MRRELCTAIPPLHVMKPSFLNLFRKKLTRDLVAPIISASVSCGIFATTDSGVPSFPKWASNSRVRASRFACLGLISSHFKTLRSPFDELRANGESLENSGSDRSC